MLSIEKAIYVSENRRNEKRNPPELCGTVSAVKISAFFFLFLLFSFRIPFPSSAENIFHFLFCFRIQFVYRVSNSHQPFRVWKVNPIVFYSTSSPFSRWTEQWRRTTDGWRLVNHAIMQQPRTDFNEWRMGSGKKFESIKLSPIKDWIGRFCYFHAQSQCAPMVKKNVSRTWIYPRCGHIDCSTGTSTHKHTVINCAWARVNVTVWVCVCWEV